MAEKLNKGEVLPSVIEPSKYSLITLSFGSSYNNFVNHVHFRVNLKLNILLYNNAIVLTDDYNLLQK